jgi:hypothetical protein
MGAFEWSAVARDSGLDAATTIEWAIRLADAAPAVFEAVAGTLDVHYQTAVVDLLIQRVALRGRQAKRILERVPNI